MTALAWSRPDLLGTRVSKCGRFTISREATLNGNRYRPWDNQRGRALSVHPYDTLTQAKLLCEDVLQDT